MTLFFWIRYQFVKIRVRDLEQSWLCSHYCWVLRRDFTLVLHKTGWSYLTVSPRWEDSQWSCERLFLHVHLILSCCGERPAGNPLRPRLLILIVLSVCVFVCVGRWRAHPRGAAEHLLGSTPTNQASDARWQWKIPSQPVTTWSSLTQICWCRPCNYNILKSVLLNNSRKSRTKNSDLTQNYLLQLRKPGKLL